MRKINYNKRSAYLNNEIVNLFSNKIIERNEDIKIVAQRYDVDESTIKYMLDKKCRYSYNMLKIASDYLNIPYDELTNILTDEEINVSKDNEEFNEIINYIFNEMIKHKRLVSK